MSGILIEPLHGTHYSLHTKPRREDPYGIEDKLDVLCIETPQHSNIKV